ncbi:MAG TPA: carboxymuconolactone decarboxylase family protein [Flavipsychrobacter sp.]|nr:carboxymuconolactone decarboxylase family protein [Flavipsychrobacter sp.]
MEAIQNETVVNLFADLGIDPSHTSLSLQRLAEQDSKYLRDLKLNVSAVLNSKNISKKDSSLLALSVAVNEKNTALMTAFENMARSQGASETEIAEVHSLTSLMNANNMFYRFKYYMDGVEYYEKTPAGLRMSIMMNPVMGKELFELASLVVSALNGCSQCVTSHERSVREHGATEARVYDAIRLGSVIKSLSIVI